MVQELSPKSSGKKIVGLTGVFGSGKSTAANLFHELGAAVVDADKLAHESLIEGSEVFDSLKEIVPEAVAAEGKLEAKKMAAIIFGDDAKRKKVEALIHPYVFARVSEEVKAAEEEVVIVEIPLLFETGYEQFCDYVLVVKAPRETIFKRLIEKGFEKHDIESRIAAQMSLEEKVSKADFIIDNSESLEKTHQDVKKTWKQLHADPKGDL